MELRIPKLRAGSFFPSLLDRRRRIDQALFAVVMEAYVHGASTPQGRRPGGRAGRRQRDLQDRSVPDLRRPRCGGGRVPDRSIGEQAFLYLFLDACSCKARTGGDRRGRGSRVANQAVVVATGVSADGRREVLGFDVGDSENGAFWTGFLRALKTRGLHGVQLVISDAHTGLKTAVS